ncbi:MAG: IPT/TIG domain-containing protein [Dehalococcoidia bacterium]
MQTQNRSLVRPGLVLALLFAAIFAARATPAFAVAPTISNVDPSTTSTEGGEMITLTGTDFTGTTGVTVDGDSVSFTEVDDTTVTFTAPEHGAGDVDVIVSNGDGPSSAATLTYEVPAPTVTSVAPVSGTTAGGTLVTITGTNFTGATQVSFGGTMVAATGVLATSLQATTPSHSAGEVDVQVITPGGTSATNANAKFTFVAPSSDPTVTSVSPTTGSPAGGTLVTITGTNFTGATSVTFGGTAATSYTVVNSTTISAVTPAHTAGTVDVIVTTPTGLSANTSADNFVYGSAPAITSISPASGPLAGGTTVIITGTGFTGATGVTFGGVAAAITNTTSTSITVTSPAHTAGTVDVAVTTALGTSPNTAADDYTYTDGPTVTSLAPTSGTTAGGTTVVITGTGFTGATGVAFGATAAADFDVDSDTQITATSPAHAAGTVDVLVTTPEGTSPNTTADNFTFGAGPNITSLSPSQGPTTGGTTVTITGTGFTGATSVTFDGIAGTSLTVVNDTTITVNTPAHANGVARVIVTTPIGSSPDVATDDFTYGTGATTTFTLYFRWSLIVWTGKNGADVAATLKNLESPDNPLTNDVSGIVTAIFYYNNPLQKFEGFFPGSAGIPGANDFTTFVTGRAYWIAINQTGSTNWTVPTN